MGEYVKTASSVIDGSVAEALRNRCAGHQLPRRGPRLRSYPRNNPYQDLGRPGIDHTQAADGIRRQGTTGAQPRVNPFVVGAPRPNRSHLRGFNAARRRPSSRREWHRGPKPHGLDRYLLDNYLLNQDDNGVRPLPPWRYYEDEVARARALSGRWAACLLYGADFGDVVAWMKLLGADPIPLNPPFDPMEGAVQLIAAGLTPHDLRWQYGDERYGSLDVRLISGQMTVDDVIVEAMARRTEA